MIAAAVCSAVLLSGCVKGATKATNIGNVDLGCLDTTDSRVIAEIYSCAMKACGYTIRSRSEKSTIADLSESAVARDVNMYPTYMTSAIRDVLKYDEEKDPDSAFEILRTGFEINLDMTAMDYSPCNYSPGIAISKEAADRLGIVTVSDLAEKAGEVRFVESPMAEGSEFDIAGLSDVYGDFAWHETVVSDDLHRYERITLGEADACAARATDGWLADGTIVFLEDDLGFWPPYNVSAVVRNDLLTHRVIMGRVLNWVDKSLTTEIMRDLNRQVDVEGKSVEKVAEEYFRSIEYDMPQL